MTELWRTLVGSHMWGMQRPDSDEDIAIITTTSTNDVFLEQIHKTKQYKEENHDITIYELGELIRGLQSGNVNYMWSVMSPCILSQTRNSLSELRQIVSENLSKNYFKAINGMATHNMYHFILHPDKLTAVEFKKKLNTIGRSLQYGINLLLYKKALFQKVDIKDKEELDKMMLNFAEVYKNSDLPEKPSPEPFERYLLKWRMYQFRQDYQ